MLSLSAAQMREWELAAEKSGISSLTLMENAGRATAAFIHSHYPGTASILFICGKGNNAGDGFVAARILYETNKKVKIYLLADVSGLKGDAEINLKKCLRLGVPVRCSDLDGEILKADLLLDAVFGTGLTREVLGGFRSAIEVMNHSGKPIVALDIPAGLNADTGEVMGIAVKAQNTVTFGALKHGLVRGSGPSYAGKVQIADIGLPPRGN